MLPSPRVHVTPAGAELVLRPARGADAAAALAYVRAFFAEASHFVLTEPEEFVHTEASEAAFFEGQDWARGDQAWLAWDGERVVGMLSAQAGRRRKIAHTIELGMGVAASVRGSGLGEALMRTCIDCARANPAVLKVALEVFADNGPAVGLYRKLGFTEEGRRIRYARRADGSFVDGLAMGLWL